MKSILLVSLLCVVASAVLYADDCPPSTPATCPTVTQGCPNVPVNGNCSVDTTYLVTYAGCVDSAHPHQAITLQVGSTRKVFAKDGLTFKINDFKAFRTSGSGAKFACNYQQQLTNVPLSAKAFTDDG